MNLIQYAEAVWSTSKASLTSTQAPPPDVPGPSKKVWQTLKNLKSSVNNLNSHRQKESCSTSCHRTPGSLGNRFGRIQCCRGQKRKSNRSSKKPVTSDTILPGNHPVDGVAELAKVYSVDTEWTRLLTPSVRNVLTYALGRSLTLEDEILVNELK